MAIQLKLKKNETVERGLKRLKKILDKEGLLKTLRDQRYFAFVRVRVVVSRKCDLPRPHRTMKRDTAPSAVSLCFVSRP